MQTKICGITNLNDAKVAVLAGTDYLGFIINYPKSPRNIEPEKVRKIIENIKIINNLPDRQAGNIKFVGVFVDQEEIPEDIGLDILQFHGNESVEYCKKYQKQFEIWKSIIIKSENDIEKIDKYKDDVDKILLDSGRGSGQKIDLKLLQKIDKIDILAGGIGLNNIKKILKLINPDIIDINSKIEREPGLKDEKDLRDIIKIIKEI